MHTVVHGIALGALFLATLAVGICVHELLHLVPLHLVDASYTVTVLPSDAASAAGRPGLQNVLSGSLVRVEVTRVPPATPEWVVRAAALLPLALALPFGLVAAGVLANPIAAGDQAGTVVLVAATACGLLSPADWSVVWHGLARSPES
ncbi:MULTISPECIES: hypothetical protein [Halorussus]|uniref:hypothetical protein n=1 Tax=Halorussus TaxID=1070314 RepID=UPI000E21660D|nr:MULTISPECIES: hypothetical protein [Halorussus]NHN58437.1 hypothetical protein [Halorussus sp. JP-T4]